MDWYNFSRLAVLGEVLLGVVCLLLFLGMIFLFMLLPGCQMIYNLPPDAVEKKIMDYQLSQIAQNSRINSSNEANHVYAN